MITATEEKRDYTRIVEKRRKQMVDQHNAKSRQKKATR